MKVLQYNWIDYLENDGGGVTIYVRNLFRSDAFPDGWEMDFISCGYAYDFLDGSIRWREALRKKSDEPVRYEIVNSGIMSPGYLMERRGYPPLEHAKTDDAFMDFIDKKGPFDILHFHNVEGVTPALFAKLKTRFPDMKLAFSAHNYFPLCPQVNLWDFRARSNCEDNNDTKRCVGCVMPSNIRHIKTSRFMNRLIKTNPRLHSFINGKIFGVGYKIYRGSKRFLRRLGRVVPRAAPARKLSGEEYYSERNRLFHEALNEHFDAIVCVSERVRDVYKRHGIRPDKMSVMYIGTAHAKRYKLTPTPGGPIGRCDGLFNMTYLGYPRDDKGFFFFLEACELMPNHIARKLSVSFYAKLNSFDLYSRIMNLRGKFYNVTHQEGYGHDELDRLLRSVSLGVVPVLWEDNLPQVALELHSRKIPIICSNLGGAQELSKCPEAIFKYGDIRDFIDKLTPIVRGGVTHEQYWKNALAPLTVDEHVAELTAFYEKLRSGAAGRDDSAPLLCRSQGENSGEVRVV